MSAMRRRAGSVATGTFGTVPGLMLLPYLTDTLGIAAIVAGVIVFLPKAWDVLLNPLVDAAVFEFSRSFIEALVIVLAVIVGVPMATLMVYSKSFSEAIQHFSLLSVGDGLAAQIPALLISVATGIIASIIANN